MSARYADFVSIKGRFHRSVSLASDWDQAASLEEYIVTPTAEELCAQMLLELGSPTGTRAWSLTGPYGGGKSAFAVFLTDLLSGTNSRHASCKGIRSRTGRKLRPFVPVLLAADRGRFDAALVSSLSRSIAGIDSSLSRRLKAFGKGEPIASTQLVEEVVEAAERVRKKNYGGLLIVIDELGKFLEFAADEPSKADPYLLQQLAEGAARSPVPILFVTILHRGFADYLPHGQDGRRAEWQKVQGRFRDVPFHLPTEQLLALVGHAIESSPNRALENAWREAFEKVISSPALDEARRRLPLADLLPDCAPLDPIAALMLWPIFRSKVAQNERSLFAFLTSHEAYSFCDFLARAELDLRNPALFGIHGLYDYVTHSLGLAAFSGHEARKWALVDEALARVPSDAPECAQAIVKTVGLLDLYGGSVGLKPCLETLRLAVAEPADFDAAIRLLEDRSILLHKRHADSYVLWEGSDFDLEQALSEARLRSSSVDWQHRMVRELDLQPVVARAHYIQRGTLRFFDVGITSSSPNEIAAAISKESDADGRILFILQESTTHRDATVRLVQDLTRGSDANQVSLVAVPVLSASLRECWEDFESWTWVRDNRPELQGDSVARREVRAQLAEARNRFEALAGPVFGLPGHPFDPSRSVWIVDGEPVEIEAALQFQRWLSTLCEVRFPLSPEFHNEILNRRTLSSAAAAARRTLIERMLTHEHEPRLGIEGNPAEATMYQAMLLEGGFHRARKELLQFGRPKKSWQSVWDAAIQFVDAASTARRPIVELFEILRMAPYGMREGPMPVLLAALLTSQRDQIALYEDGLFVPELRIEVFERLLSKPATFEIQSHKLDKSQRAALDALARMSAGGASDSERGLLPIVKSLVLAATRLPPFAKRTRKLPATALLVREALLSSTDPKDLLFRALPEAVDRPLVKPSDAEPFALALRGALLALTRAYPALLDSVEEQIRTAFALPGAATRATATLKRRSTPLVRFASERRIQSFVREASQPSKDRDWREALARVVNDGLPSSQWSDADTSRFQMHLQELVAEFERLEEIVAQRSGEVSGKMIRLGILGDNYSEARAFIEVDDALQPQVEQAAEALQEAFRQLAAKGELSKQVRLAAIARLVEEEIADESGAPS